MLLGIKICSIRIKFYGQSGDRKFQLSKNLFMYFEVNNSGFKTGFLIPLAILKAGGKVCFKLSIFTVFQKLYLLQLLKDFICLFKKMQRGT